MGDQIRFPQHEWPNSCRAHSFQRCRPYGFVTCGFTVHITSSQDVQLTLTFLSIFMCLMVCDVVLDGVCIPCNGSTAGSEKVARIDGLPLHCQSLSPMPLFSFRVHGHEEGLLRCVLER